MLVMLFSTMSFLAAAICLVFGTMVLLKDNHSRLNQVFMLLCLSVAYWAFMEFELRHSSALEEAEFWFRLNFLWPVSIALLVHFVLIFTEQRWLTENKLMYLLLYGSTATISVLDLAIHRMQGTPFEGYWGWTYDFPDSLSFRVSIAIVVALSISAVFFALRFHLKQSDPIKRKQTRLVLIGLAIPIVFGSMADAILPALGIRVPEMSIISFAVGVAGFIGFAIWKYELFGVTPAQAAENIIATISDSLFIVNPRGAVLTTNRAAAGLLGYHEEELIGFPLGKIFGGDGIAKSNGEARGSSCVVKDVTDLETNLISREGHYIPVSLSSSTLRDKSNQILGKVIIAHDMTHRRRNEDKILAQTAELEQYFKFFQGATDLMATADPNGAFLKTNPACSETLGYSEAELITKPFIEFVHPDDKQKTLDEMVRQQKIGDSFNFENRYVCKDGSIRWLSWRATYNKNDGLTYATARDTSKLKQAEAKILAQSEELKSINRELQTLNRITAEISQTIDLDKLLHHALDTITDSGLFDIQHMGGIFIAEGEKLNLVAHLGNDDKFLELHENLTFDNCLCGQAARTGETVISSHCSGDERPTIRYPGMEDHGHAIVPLKTADQVVGVLYLYLPAGAEINSSGRDLLQNIGSQLAVSIENAKLYEETKQMSLHDSLTGLANRNLMKNELEKEFAVSQRTGRPVSVIMLDLDHFKKYNDYYGHAAGDRLLVNVAALISREIRVIDIAARYGGEEFLAILPDTAPEPAALVAERIRKTIELTEFFLSEGRQPTHITVSLGVATYDVHISNEDMLVARADASLYRAKNNGRNRVEVWLPLMYQDTA